jgi:hypothetical protein
MCVIEGFLELTGASSYDDIKVFPEWNIQPNRSLNVFKKRKLNNPSNASTI